MRDSLLIILSKYMNSTTITLKFSVIVVEFIYTDTFVPPLSKSYLHPCIQVSHFPFNYFPSSPMILGPLF